MKICIEFEDTLQQSRLSKLKCKSDVFMKRRNFCGQRWDVDEFSRKFYLKLLLLFKKPPQLKTFLKNAMSLIKIYGQRIAHKSFL